MSKQILAIASCRVSSDEQLLNNSLKRQRNAVLEAAQELNATIPEQYWWSGSVSSKKGTNVNRKDLKAMQDACKKDKRIKYLIVDEPDRFMRSLNEAMYFEVSFQLLGVQVWYACSPELNKGDLAAKLLKFSKYIQAEGSNDERISKSLSGALDSLKDGRYPGPIKPGYRKGYVSGVQEIDPIFGPILQDVLVSIATERLEPSEALKEFNTTKFREGKPPLKMDKFRILVTDCFNAGMVEINKQVQYRNEDALHDALITKEQYEKIVEIMSNKKKSQTGPRRNGNPDFPMNNLITCVACVGEKYPRIVGFPQNNGVNKERIYKRYKCRACNKTILLEQLHAKVEELLGQLTFDEQRYKLLVQAMDDVWKVEDSSVNEEIAKLKTAIRSIKETISSKVDAATDKTNARIRTHIMDSIERHEADLAQKEDKLQELVASKELNKKDFYEFALCFIADAGTNFFDISRDNRLKCKQLLFPDDIYIDPGKNVYTTKVSPLYRLEPSKKDAEASELARMVRVRGL